MTDSSEPPFFQREEVRTIATELLRVPESVGVAQNQDVAASYALNLIRILRDRLGVSPETLEFVYRPLAEIVPSLSDFVIRYSHGEIPRQVAEEVLQHLERDMRQHYSIRGINFCDPRLIPQETFFDFQGMPGAEPLHKETVQQILHQLETIITTHVPAYVLGGLTPQSLAQDVYDSSLHNPAGVIDFARLMDGLGCLLVKKEYLDLSLALGAATPTREQLASRFFTALKQAYSSFGLPLPPFRSAEEIRKSHVTDERYQRELRDYNSTLEKLLLMP